MFFNVTTDGVVLYMKKGSLLNFFHVPYTNMYAILHLPTNTYYALRPREATKHSMVFFRDYDHAKYVADSLATHHWIYGKLPPPSDELYLMKPYQKKQEASEHHLWVAKRNASMRCIQDVGTRQLDISLVNALRWLDDDTYDVDMKWYELDVNTPTYLESLALDNQIVIE